MDDVVGDMGLLLTSLISKAAPVQEILFTFIGGVDTDGPQQRGSWSLESSGEYKHYFSGKGLCSKTDLVNTQPPSWQMFPVGNSLCPDSGSHKLRYAVLCAGSLFSSQNRLRIRKHQNQNKTNNRKFEAMP